MFKRLFLSIIILSALASETGAYFPANIIDLYLLNFIPLDIVQGSNNTLAKDEAQDTGLAGQNGIPVAFFKVLADEAVNASNTYGKHGGVPYVVDYMCIFVFSLVTSFYIKNTPTLCSRGSLFRITDTSPPVFC